MRAEHWRAITEVAETQAGLATSAQMRLVGASPTEIDEAIREGWLLRVRHGVVAVAGAPVDIRRPIRAAALASPGAVVSHRSAAWLHGLLTNRPSLVDLTRPDRRVMAVGVRGHRAVVSDADVADCDGIPVTSVVRTLVDLTASLPPDWLERLVHEAVMRRLCNYDDLRSAAEGRPGDECAAAMLALVGELNGTTPLEARWEQILRATGLPPAASQFQVAIDERVYVLDFAWPDARVALEVNGFAFHNTRDSFDRDHDKVVALQAAGWNVISATSKTPTAHVLTALNRAISTGTGPVEIATGSRAGGG